MFTRRIRWSLLLLVFLLLILLGVRTVKAKSNCSEATLNGTYAALEQGTVVGQLPGFPPPPWRFANSAIATFDGAGNLSGTFTGSAGGGLATGPFTGTYTVNPDCTYSDEFTPFTGIVLHHAGTITGTGIFREIHYLYSDAGTIVSGTLKKTPAGGCSEASLTGAYAGTEEGRFVVQFPGFPPPPVLFAGSTMHVYDGAGNSSGEATVSIQGAIVPTTFTGTYTVNPDCTYSEKLTLASGAVIHNTGTITGQGVFRETHYIWSVPGTVIFGTLKKK